MVDTACSEEEFRVFLGHIEGKPSPVAPTSVPVLWRLAREFEFDGLAPFLNLSRPQPSADSREALASDPGSLTAIRAFLRTLDERILSAEREHARFSARVERLIETIENRVSVAFKNLVALNGQIQGLAEQLRTFSSDRQPLARDLTAFKRSERGPRSNVALPIGCGVRGRLPQDRGVIAYLTERFGGHVDTCGLVAVSASSVQAPHAPANAADFLTDKLFASENLPEQWLCYDFKDRRVEVEKYAIQTSGKFRNTPRQWVLEGSQDGRMWEELDSCDNGTDQLGVTVLYNVRKRALARMVRIRQTAVNAEGDWNLLIGAFELFGALHDSSG
jgi:hypothetical protein